MPKVPEYNLPKFPNIPYNKPPTVVGMKKTVKKDHIKDIDFRKREVRQAEHITVFKDWYNTLVNRPYSDTNQAQIAMLSAVLWHLLPKQEFKKLVTSKVDLAQTSDEYQTKLANKLSWI